MRADRRIDQALTLASEMGVSVERVDGAVLQRLARGGVHQDIVAEVTAAEEHSVEDLVAAAGAQPPLLVVLDGIEDPHNVGAILRTADAAGVHGVVRQTRHAASLDGVVAKASAGALAHVRIATVVNIARAVDELKEAGVWTIGLDGSAPERYDAPDLTLPTAIVARRRRHRPASSRARAVRSDRVDPDGRRGQQSECVGSGRHHVVRGGTSAPVGASYSAGRPSGIAGTDLGREAPDCLCCSSAVVKNSGGLAPVARAVLQILFCLGWLA